MTKLLDGIKDEPTYQSKNLARQIRPEYLEIAIAYYEGDVSISQIRGYLNKRAEFENLDTQASSLIYLMNRVLRDAVVRGKVKLVVVDETQP